VSPGRGVGKDDAEIHATILTTPAQRTALNFYIGGVLHHIHGGHLKTRLALGEGPSEFDPEDLTRPGRMDRLILVDPRPPYVLLSRIKVQLEEIPASRTARASPSYATSGYAGLVT
jgi:hypothetical protein